LSYITKTIARSAIQKMRDFHQIQIDAHKDFGMDFLENLGRRNCMMSQSQETFIANELSQTYKDVVCDGRPGQPDIVIPSLGKELECKLTTRNRSGQISFQTDYETLRSKGSLDYLYIVASDDFSEFAVFHFEDLTIDNFRLPANGSRGRSQMIKSTCLNNCNLVFGFVSVNNEIHLESLEEKYSSVKAKSDAREREIKRKIAQCTAKAIKKRENLSSLLEREMSRYQSRLEKINNKISYWKSTPEKYTISLEPIA
jgi:hypothetical protein